MKGADFIGDAPLIKKLITEVSPAPTYVEHFALAGHVDDKIARRCTAGHAMLSRCNGTHKRWY